MSTEGTVETTAENLSEEVTEETSVSQIDPEKLAPALEAILFSSADPTPANKLSEALGKVGVASIKKAIGALNETYEAGGHTFRIRQVGGGYQFFVLPNYTDYVKLLYTKERKLRLTKAALETMAIIAYKQPISKNQIEYIRGVACDGVVSNLLEKSLIKISGRSESVGRPLLYSATDEFLKFFGLNAFDELPRIAEVEEMIAEMEAERRLRNPEPEDELGQGDHEVDDHTAESNEDVEMAAIPTTLSDESDESEESEESVETGEPVETEPVEAEPVTAKE